VRVIWAARMRAEGTVQRSAVGGIGGAISCGATRHTWPRGDGGHGDAPEGRTPPTRDLHPPLVPCIPRALATLKIMAGSLGTHLARFGWCYFLALPGSPS
jgi:hypothetical protein